MIHVERMVRNGNSITWTWQKTP